MKKYIFLLLPLVIGLASCNDSIPNTSNTEAVNKLKTLLNKQDLSEFHSKAIGTMFTQEFDVLDVYKDEDDKSSSYFNYTGLGFLDFYYDLSSEEYKTVVDENGNVNVFDAIKEGEGGYRITQNAKMSSFSRVGGDYATNQNLGINQQMTLKSNEEDVFVYNILDVTDGDSYDYESRQNLNAKIDKELLFDSISTRSFREIFSNVHLFDAPSNIEYLDRLYFSSCKELVKMNDQEISNFITRHNILIEEVDDKIELSFIYKNDEIKEEYVDVIFPGDIKGKLAYDKETGEFLEFDYTIKYLNEIYDEESGSVKTASMAFECSGQSARAPIGDMWLPEDPTVYTEVIGFLEDVREQVIPPSIYQ